MTLEEIAEYTHRSGTLLLDKTTSKPWKGGDYVPGKKGGTWYDTILSDPKTFNQYIAERDAESAGIIGVTTDYLSDYDAYKREWKPRCASASIETDEKKGTLTVHFTLRDNLYWTWYGSDKKVPVTSDDAVFWYNEVSGDPAFQSSGYGQQFVTMSDGTEKHIDIVKIDDKRFDFVFPRIVADPMLATNMSLAPSFIYRPAKEKGGIEAVKKLFSVADDPKTIPSMGRWYIVSYKSAQRIVLKRNPYFWDVDSNNVSQPYPEEEIIQIVGDQNTDYLLFKQGKQETYTPRPEEVDAVVKGQGSDYTVFNAAGAMGAPFWSFNQNVRNKDKPYYEWFSKKEFRQAMSCLVNRERIITQTYRGLAEPKYDFFPSANPYYNNSITLKYRFDVQKAAALLESCGIKKGADGKMHDEKGRAVEFDLTVPSSSTVSNDIAQILSDECSKIGITVNVRQTDFQKIIEMLTSTYDWQSVIISLGANAFPSQGSNVWPSNGNLHLWYPEQKEPATEWEAKVDHLYNEGSYTNDHDAAAKIWNEYQTILLEQCPIIYLVRARSFFAIRNKWDLTNVYYDNMNGAMTEHVFIKDN
jgi:peptide/nickel transport system substrate-binding protein